MDFLQDLREHNIRRQNLWPADFPVDEIYKSNELMNEAGELAGAIKKMFRHRHSIAGNVVKNEEDLRKNLEEEIGDVLICLDLLAAFYGVDIEKVTRDKFNQTSKKVEIPVYL